MTIDVDGTEADLSAVHPSASDRIAPLSERTVPLFGAFLLIGVFALAAVMLTVLNRPPQQLTEHPTSRRSHVVLSHWLHEGYFHYVGMVNRNPDGEGLYLNSTGAYMFSGFVVEKIYVLFAGHYSYRLLGLHNQIISMLISVLAGLLSYRVARRFALDPTLSFAVGSAVIVVLFTFPDNLDLYWEMSAQAYALMFALVYLLIEERALDVASRPRTLLLAQAGAMLMIAFMEVIVAVGFAVSLFAVSILVRRDGSWRRLVMTVAVPCLAAFALYQLQVRLAQWRFPDVPRTGSAMMFRTGLDGDSRDYGDHLDIATRRDIARINWPANREHLFRWTWVFILGLTSLLGTFIAFVRRRAPAIALEVVATLAGSWVIYAAVFSQSVVIHPYLYDVLLFAPLCLALFAVAPALVESLTGRTGTVVLVIVFCAFWYTLFQMRLFALRYPLPKASIAAAVKAYNCSRL